MNRFLTSLFLVLCLQLTACELLPTQPDHVLPNGEWLLTPEELMYAYESRVENPIAYKAFAYYLSTEYRRTHNEFRKHDILREIKPTVDARLDEAFDRKDYVLRFERNIGEYDFGSGAFHTGFAKFGYLHYTGNYGISFTNGLEWELFSMPKDLARDVINRGKRKVRWEARVRVQSVERRKIAAGPFSFLEGKRKVLNVAIKHLEIYW